MLEKYPDINQVWIVAGLQRSTPFNKPDELDLDEIALELNTNRV